MFVRSLWRDGQSVSRATQHPTAEARNNFCSRRDDSSIADALSLPAVPLELTFRNASRDARQHKDLNGSNPSTESVTTTLHVL